MSCQPTFRCALDGMTAPEQSDTHRDLQLALHTATSLQSTIRHADAKAQLLLGFQAGLAMIVAEEGSGFSARHEVLLPVAMLLAIAWFAGLTVGGRHLVKVVAPRLTGTQPANRFAFPTTRPTTETIQDQRNEAWDQVAALSAIAVAKHSLVRRSLPALTLASVSVGALLTLALIVSNAP
jgi:hypothetical protein